MRGTRVFISSRFGEFKGLRDELRKSFLVDSDVELVMLDDGAAAPSTARDRSFEMLRTCDFAVFLLGRSYSDQENATPESLEPSLTEGEFDVAMAMNAKGAGLVVLAWSRGSDDLASWDPRAASFLEKARKERVVGELGSRSDEEQAALIASRIAVAIEERENEEGREAETTFHASLTYSLLPFGMTLDAAEIDPLREPNEFRRAHLFQRNSAITTLGNIGDLRGFEEQLNKVSEVIPDDLLNNLLLVLLYLHRDRPSDRKSATLVASRLTKSVQGPALQVSDEQSTRRSAEIAALRAKVARLAVPVGVRADHDSILESLNQANKEFPVSRAVLAERVASAWMRFESSGNGTLSDDAAIDAVSKIAVDLVSVYPDFATSFFESIGLSDAVVSSIRKNILGQVHHSLGIEERSRKLKRTINTVRQSSEALSGELSPVFINLCELEKKSETIENEGVPREVKELVTAANSMTFKSCVVASDFSSLESLDALRCRLDESSVAARSALAGDEHKMTESSSWTDDGACEVIRSKVDEVDDELVGLQADQLRLTRWIGRLALRGNRRWLRVAARGLFGLLVALVILKTGVLRSQIHDVVHSVTVRNWYEAIVNVPDKISNSSFGQTTGTVLAALAVVGIVVAAAAGAIRGGGIGAFLGFLAGCAALFVAFAVFYIVVVLVVITIASSACAIFGFALTALPLLLVSRSLRETTQRNQELIESLNRERGHLVGLHDALHALSVVASTARETVERHVTERASRDSERNALEQSVRDLIRVFNSSFSARPAVYNREYVPRERASDGDLTRRTVSSESTREVMGRDVGWRDSRFLPVPVTRSSLATIEAKGLERFASDIGRRLSGEAAPQTDNSKKLAHLADAPSVLLSSLAFE